MHLKCYKEISGDYFVQSFDFLQVQAIQNELSKQNDAIEKETASIRENVVTQLEKVALLSESMMSVYFNAVRDEPYLGGGEEYLTFSRCTVNSCLNKTR